MSRMYPNEEFIRFMGRNYFSIPKEERSKIKFLELGCGTGANLWVLAKEGFDAFGIDIDNKALEKCVDNVSQYSNNRFAVMINNMVNLAQGQENQYDCVLDIFSTYAINQSDFEKTLKGIHKVLKPGGVFFSYTPSTGSDVFCKSLNGSGPYTLNGIIREGSPYFGVTGPFRFINSLKVKELLDENGFSLRYLEKVSRTYNNTTEYFEFLVFEAVKI